jgi:hypothetical protein
VATGKLLDLGGIDNRSPKTTQGMGNFRVARNVYPTPDKRIIPRYDNTEATEQPTNTKCVHSITQYENDKVYMTSESSGSSAAYKFYRNSTKIPSSSSFPISPFEEIIDHDWPQAVQTFRRNNTVFFSIPFTGSLMKYDGVEMSPAGCQQPNVSSPNKTEGGKIVRVVQHTLDFDNNEPWSEYVQFYTTPYPTFPATTTLNSPLVTLVSATTALSVGQYVFGVGIPENTQIQYVLSPTVIILTNNVGYTGANTISVSASVNVTIRTDTGGTNLVGQTNVEPTSILQPTVSQLSYFKNGYCTYNSSTEDYSVLASPGSVAAVYSTSSLIVPLANLQYLRPQMLITSKLFLLGTANGTTLISGLATTANIAAGMAVISVSGSVIPPGTTVVSKTVNSITLSNPVPAGSVQFTVDFDLLPADTRILSIDASTGVFTLSNLISAYSGNILLSIAFDTNILTTDTFRIGSYVFVAKDNISPSTAGISAYYSEYVGVALKIKSVNPLKLDGNDAYCLTQNREWRKIEVKSTAFADLILYGTKTFVSVWESLSTRGIYYFRKLMPSFPDSTQNYSEYVTLDGLAIAASGYNLNLFTLGPSLNQIYDVNSRKFSVNSSANLGGKYPLTSSTIYQDQLLMANDDIIWFSDSTLGGAFEQFNTSLFIRVGDSDYGRITSICGTNDFLVVCRERKNYYINGNLSTGNYRVQEITGAEVGAWSNTSSILIKDSVIFITAIGVFQVSDGGRCVKLSQNCPKNFSTYDNMSINEDVSFRLTGTIADPTIQDFVFEDIENNGIIAAYDEFRELLVFLKRGTSNPCFVLNTRDMQFYEWDGLIFSDTKYINCIQFISGNYIIGEFDSEENSYNAKIYLEDKEAALQYPVTNPIKLYTTWLTANEPSLEKILLQLKIFGRIQSNSTTSSINVCHYKDWDINNKITNSPYFPNNTSLQLNDQVQYSHKKRLNSDKILSASIGLEVDTSNVTFEIESFEVEINSIQEGIKK